jgi:hypothetical protein
MTVARYLLVRHFLERVQPGAAPHLDRPAA